MLNKRKSLTVNWIGSRRRLFVELSGSGFVGSRLFWRISWPVGVFLGSGEGLGHLVQFVSSVVTEIGIYTGMAFYLGTGLF